MLDGLGIILSQWVFVWDPSFMLKSYGWWVVGSGGGGGGGGGLKDFSVSPGSESTEPELLSLSH